jgi:general stress protein 26
MMSETSHTDKSEAELQDRAWELAKSIGTCMFTTWDGNRQRARPMAATVKRDEHALYFLTDADSEKVRQAKQFPTVTATFADVGGNKFVSISGEATVENDRAKIKELWTTFARAWWPSADDPAIRVVTIRPEDAELWDSPNKLVTTAVMLKALATGRQRPKLGDNARVEI